MKEITQEYIESLGFKYNNGEYISSIHRDYRFVIRKEGNDLWISIRELWGAEDTVFDGTIFYPMDLKLILRSVGHNRWN
jgi:hypothetical protein